LRRRLRWHLAKKNGDVYLGFKAYQSHDVVQTAHCMVVSTELNQLRQCLEVAFSTTSKALPSSVYAVQLNDGIHAVLEYEQAPDIESFEAELWSEAPAIQFWKSYQGRLQPLSRPALKLHDLLPTASKNLAIQIGPDDFVQGQAYGNRSMVHQILSWSAGERYVVDLFSGVGNLSLPLAASGMQVLGAEVNEASVRVANANAKRLKIAAVYQRADLFKNFETASFAGADVLLVDPPRKGAKNICQLLPRLLPKKLILIHCDVTSARRDALEVMAQGYRLKACKALDLFPFSGHVESMSLWVQ